MGKFDIRKYVAANETLGHTINYLINSFARKGLRLISIPVFTYLLTPADYGVLNIFTANVELAAILFTLNGTVGVGRYYFEEGKQDFNTLLFTSMVFSFSLLAIFGIVLSWQGNFFAELIDLPEGTIKYIVPAAVLIVMSNYLLAVFRAAGRSREIRNFGIQKTYVQFILSVLIMLLLSSEIYYGRIWSFTLAALIFGGIALRKLWMYIEPKFQAKHLIYLFSYSLPLLPAYLGTLVLSYFDRMMLNSMVSEESAGLYSFAYNIAGLQYMVSNAVMNAWVPKYYKQMNTGNYKALDQQGVRLFKIIGLATLALVAFGQYIGIVLGSKSFHEALSIIPVVIMGQFFMTFSVLYKNSISFSKKTILSTIAILSSAILNIGLNYILIPKYGMIAAAWTTFAAYGMQAFIMMFVVRKFLKVHSLAPKMVLPSVAYVVLTAAVLGGFYFLNLSYILDILFKTLVLIGISTILFKHKVYSILKQFKSSK
ncbi:MAG: polysaccharide biosynthesis C-terminal domain-containing protein [Bacteroidetes bacterium]|nr:polysaccharide biosynthesis C-terminal domain-containing protein [Bacteroidota bacterium]